MIETPPPIHTWPQLPPDHPYHVPPGYSAPDNLPPGHPGVLDNWPTTYEDDQASSD